VNSVVTKSGRELMRAVMNRNRFVGHLRCGNTKMKMDFERLTVATPAKASRTDRARFKVRRL